MSDYKIVDLGSYSGKSMSKIPFGAYFLDDGVVHFSIFCDISNSIILCIYGSGDDSEEIFRVRMVDHDCGIWRVAIKGLCAGQKYGYRVNGTFSPENGLWANPYKLLIDPYARAIDSGAKSHDLMVDRLDSNILKYQMQAGISTSLYWRDEVDSAEVVPRSVLVRDDFDWGDDKYLNTSWKDTIIYEVHVKGFSKLNKKIPKELRGTFAGLGHSESVKYLQDLGVTAVQLLPVQMHLDDKFLLEKGLVNYWGYNTIGFFAPEYQYASNRIDGGMVSEFKDMVKSLHAGGIEVILDVVYNHTGEGGNGGPTLNFRALNNLDYYRISHQNHMDYINHSGCGNTVNFGSKEVCKFVLNSLRYWVEEMHVDGFRFDLGTILGRAKKDYFDKEAIFFQMLDQDPVLSKVKLIAEPWDLSTYELGNFPNSWSELNDRYRDNVRSFWRGDFKKVQGFSEALTGSQFEFSRGCRKPQSSINFISSHDGFTLRDIVSYNTKHNYANAENNADGHGGDNFTYNYGIEGESEDEDVNQLRRRQMRNIMLTLVLSHGVPFILGGDEICRTKRGNNNTYCQDNELNWHNWDRSEWEDSFYNFTKKVISFRKRHFVFRRNQYFNGKTVKGNFEMKDVCWYQSNGNLMDNYSWNDAHTKLLMMTLCGEALSKPGLWQRRNNDNYFLLIFNAADAEVEIKIPERDIIKKWKLKIDTFEEESFIGNGLELNAGDNFMVRGRSTLLFKNTFS